MIIELSLPLLSPLGSIPQQPDIGPVIGILLILAWSLPLTVIATATTGYIAGRLSRVSKASIKGTGIGVAIGILSWIFFGLLVLLMGNFLAQQGDSTIILVIGLLGAALGMLSTWFVVRKKYSTDTGA